MKLGLFLSAQHPPGAAPQAALAAHLDQVRFARDGGFASVFAGQHFLAEPYQMFQPVPLLARVAAESGDMVVGTGVLLIALLNPVEVAENAATLAALTGGRFVLGVGLGYRPEEDAALGLVGNRIAVFESKLDVIKRLLAGEEVTATGPGYTLDRARLKMRFARRPALWMAANSDGAVRRAARLADTWFANPHVTVTQLARQVEIFRAARGERPAELPVLREVCVAPTDEEAIATARPHLDDKYRTYVEWGQSDVLPTGDTLRREWDDLRAGRFLLGSPATVLGEIGQLQAAGFTHLVARVQWPGLSPDAAMRSLALLASQVIPHL